MRLTRTIAVFLAGMASAGVAYQAINMTASAQQGGAVAHTAGDVVSYALGWDLGQETLENLELDGVMVDRESMVLGFQAAIGGNDPAYDDQRMHNELIEFNDEIFARAHRERLANDPVYQAQAAANARAGDAFRRRFAELPGVQQNDSGTLYRIERPGDGASPAIGASIIANYRMLTLDGTEVGEGDGVVIDTRTMLRPTQELVHQMKIGAKWTIVVNPKGSERMAGRGFGVGPNETIVVELELLGIADRDGD